MKPSLLYVFAGLFFMLSCTKKEKAPVNNLNSSFGSRNEVVLVIEDSLWIGTIGDSIRAKLAKPIVGITDQEPIFDLVQLDPKIFTKKAKTARNIVLFSTQTAHEFILEKSLNATPQNFFFIRAKTNDDLIKLFNSNADSIISVFKSSEMNEEMHKVVRSSKLNYKELKELFGCTLKIPDSYHLQMENESPFLWYQKDLSSGNVNLVLYEFPINEIETNEFTLENRLIEAKNVIGKSFLKTAKDSAYFIVSPQFTPIIKKKTIQNLPAYQIIGAWETVNDYLKGPFVCYAIRDDYYNRYLFIEGFVNNPFKNKRDQLLEIEAIINTLNFNESPN